MRDEFNRDIEYIRISVTDRCNLRCVYCCLLYTSWDSFFQIVKSAVKRYGSHKIFLNMKLLSSVCLKTMSSLREQDTGLCVNFYKHFIKIL